MHSRKQTMLENFNQVLKRNLPENLAVEESKMVAVECITYYRDRMTLVKEARLFTSKIIQPLPVPEKMLVFRWGRAESGKDVVKNSKAMS
jgi:hypothetical protein